MTKMVTRADGQVTYVSEQFLDSVVQEGDTVEDMPVLERQEPTAEEIANNLVASENYDARKYLAETDWYVTRKAEAGTAIPSDIATYRTAVRTTSGTMETKVKAISDTTNQTNMDAFIALKSDTYKEDGSIDKVADLNNWPTRPEILD